MPYSLRPDQIRREMERQRRKDIFDSVLTVIVMTVLLALIIIGLISYVVNN